MNKVSCPFCGMTFEDDYWAKAEDQIIIHNKIEYGLGILTINIDGDLEKIGEDFKK